MPAEFFMVERRPRVFCAQRKHFPKAKHLVNQVTVVIRYIKDDHPTDLITIENIDAI